MSEYNEKICFFEGKYIPLSQANLNVRTHALQYGTACFGGIRGYWNEDLKKLHVFRLNDHYNRLMQSAKILQMKMPFSTDELVNITLQVLQKGKWSQNVYMRPFLYKSALELSPRLHNVKDDFALYAIPLDDYIDTKKGLNTCISSWVRISDNQIPTRSKATGGYINSALAKSEALENGFDEAIFLDSNGFVSEGSAENIFIVREGKLLTPPVTASVLEGITRRSVLQIAEDLGIPVEIRNISRTELYIADEAFFSGTGAQIAYIREIDRRVIGKGEAGAITVKLRDLFFRIVRGEEKKYLSWLTLVEA